MLQIFGLLIVLPALYAFESRLPHCDGLYKDVSSQLPMKLTNGYSDDVFKTNLDKVLRKFFDPTIETYRTEIEATHTNFNTSEFFKDVMLDEIKYLLNLNHQHLIDLALVKKKETADAIKDHILKPWKKTENIKTIVDHIKVEMEAKCREILTSVELRVTDFQAEMQKIAAQREKTQFLAIAEAFQTELTELLSVMGPAAAALQKESTADKTQLDALKKKITDYVAPATCSRADIHKFFETETNNLIMLHKKYIGDAHGKVATLDIKSASVTDSLVPQDKLATKPAGAAGPVTLKDAVGATPPASASH